MQESITLIGRPFPVTALAVDRGGGEPHGIIGRAMAEVTTTMPYEQFAAQLQEAIGMVQAVAERFKAEIAEYTAEEIAIGLAVSGEGNIGIATAGVEASIQVTFKRKASEKG